MIETDGLTKQYAGGQPAVDHLSLTVREQEIFGFLGPNGAGKTSTIRILTTLARPSSGSARVAGYDVVEKPREVRKRIGYVAQESGVEYCLTGRENLLLQGRLYHMDRKTIARRMDELLQLFDLTAMADRLVSQYSGGMRRKLDIAMALLHQPRLLFLDEPTLGLDPQSRMGLWEYIRGINRSEGITIFLTTHYLEEADKLAHRVGILDQGRMKTMDSPEGLKDSIGGDVIILSLERNGGWALQPQVEQRLRSFPFVKDLLLVEDECSVYVQQGREALPKLLQVMDGANVPVKAATLSRPSLDDVYLKYTGKRFKEETEQSGGGDWQKWWKPQADPGDSAQDGASQWPAASGQEAGGQGQEQEQGANWNWKDHASGR